MIRRIVRHSRLRRVFYSLVLSSIEAFVAILGVVSGLPVLFNPEALAPTSILRLLPPFAVLAWGAGLALGGALSLAGILSVQYRIERIGTMLLALTSGIFALALSLFLPRSLIFFLIYVLFCLAMVARYWVLGRLISQIQQIWEEAIHAR